MKKKCKLMIFPFILAMIMTLIPEKTAASIAVSAKSAIVMEQSSGRILFEKDAHTQRRIASITKIMTAILAIESGKLDEIVEVSEAAIRTEGSSSYLIAGEKIKLEDLVYALMLRSGNDAAVSIAENVGGSLDGFVYLMNQKAEEIGMTNTYFANPHGLDDHENHLSTAYDMALLTRYAMKNEEYRKISGTEVHKAPHPTEKSDREWNNKNRLLEMYEYCTGGKTGYTKRAKRTLVTTATKAGMDLIAVTLDAQSSSDWNDHIQMYESAYQSYTIVEVLPKGSIKEVTKKFYKQKVYVKSGYFYPVASKEKDLFHIEFKMMKPKQEWKEDKSTPNIVGRAIIYLDNEKLAQIPIYFKATEKKAKRTFFKQFRNQFTAIVGVKIDG